VGIHKRKILRKKQKENTLSTKKSKSEEKRKKTTKKHDFVHAFEQENFKMKIKKPRKKKAL